ncbi:MAG: AAA family ATPase [Thermoanaerobaculia bacterium]
MSLQLRFLGEIEVARAGMRVDLPQSKKTRALLAYLALSGKTHRRERLCALLWDIAEDPRAALRWSLSKLRGVVDDDAASRIHADRNHVTFAGDDVWIDILHVRDALASGVATLPTETLQDLDRLFRGEFLEDVELSDYADFHAWFVAFREESRAMRDAIANELKQRKPVSRIVAPMLDIAKSERGLVGRDAELAQIESLLEARSTHIIVLTGDYGLGKSRILKEVTTHARSRGRMVLGARAFEAEMGRPYGPWLDALLQIPGVALESLISNQKSRDSFFATVSELIGSRECVVMFDDVQWLDASSAELLHYVARTNRERALLFILAARGGELLDNEAAMRVLRGLRREGIVDEIHLQLLSEDAIVTLVRSIDPQADANRIYRESGGNPLFAIELARSRGDGAGGISRLIRDRVERLPEDAAEVLRWCAVLGLSFTLRHLEQSAGRATEPLLRALDALERHDFIRAEPSRQDVYAFAHDVVRRAVYQDLSEARRRLMHLRVAGVLEDAADIAHHAALGGDNALAARSCVEAARRCLRLFAGAEADALAKRGLQYAASLPDRERVQLLLELHEIRFAVRRPQQFDEFASEIEKLAEQALDLDLPEHARLGFQILAYLRWEVGGSEDAQRHMLRAELVSRGGDAQQRIVAMAEAARCLVLLERDLLRAEALALEAGALAHRAGFEPFAIPDAVGMLRLHQHQFDEARAAFRHALELAKTTRNRMAEFTAIEHLVMTEFEAQSYASAASLAEQLIPLAQKLREGSEVPIAFALAALCRYANGESDALESHLAALRAVDAKQRLTYVLTRAASIDVARGEVATAQSRAEEALRLAEILERPSDIARARTILEKE